MILGEFLEMIENSTDEEYMPLHREVILRVVDGGQVNESSDIYVVLEDNAIVLTNESL